MSDCFTSSALGSSGPDSRKATGTVNFTFTASPLCLPGFHLGMAAKDDPTPEGGSVKGENEDEVFTMVEVMPKFPGGQAGLFQYLARSIKYPVIAQKSKEQGRVIIQMVISKDGSLSNIKVLRSVSPSLDAEAVRVVGNMPKWEPGMQKGQPVSVKYTIPIVFRLQ